MTKINFSNMYVGKIDAKDEISKSDENSKSKFMNSYIIPDNLDLAMFLKNDFSFITGLKGTGKTALLRYLAYFSEEEFESFYSFILFKSDYNTFDKDSMIKLIDKDYINQLEQYSNADYEIIWRWILHRHIVYKIQSYSQEVAPQFSQSNAWDQYESFVAQPPKDGVITKLRGSLSKANVELVGSVLDGNLAAKIGFEFDFNNIGDNKVKFNNLVSRADYLVANLPQLEKPLYIMLDELELSYESEESYLRDQILIRDLIVSVYRLNSIFKDNGINIKIICAVRSEVVNAIESSGKEINKYIDSDGYPIKWDYPKAQGIDHPLIKILLNKIRITEQNNGNGSMSDSEIWKKWFVPTIHFRPVDKYILRYTWYRPRDIVRLLTKARSNFPRKHMFDQEVLDGLHGDISTESWNELVEELKASYSSEEIRALKNILQGFQRKFSYEQYVAHAEELRIHYPNAARIFEYPRKALASLYRVGIIGNIDASGHQRWASRQNADILFTDDFYFQVHPALWHHLSLFNKGHNPENLKQPQGKKKEGGVVEKRTVIESTIDFIGEVSSVNSLKGFTFIKCGEYDALALFSNIEGDTSCIKRGDLYRCRLKTREKGPFVIKAVPV